MTTAQFGREREAVGAVVDDGHVPATPDHRLGDPETTDLDRRTRLVRCARVWLLGYAVVLAASGLLNFARTGFDPSGHVHGVRLALLPLACAVLASMLGGHRRAGRLAIDAGILLVAAMTANYARLGLKTLDVLMVDPVRLTLFATLAGAGALTAVRLLAARLPSPHIAQLGRGVTGLLGAGLLAAGLLISGGFDATRQSAAGVVEMARVAREFDDQIRLILDDPERLQRVAADPRTRALAARFVQDDRFASHDRLRAIATRVADGDTSVIRDLVDHRALSSTIVAELDLTSETGQGDLTVAPGHLITNEAAPEHQPDPVQAMTRAIAELRRHAGALPAHRLRELRDIDLADPRVAAKLAELDIDPELVATLIRGGGPPPGLADLAGATSASAERPVAGPAQGPPQLLAHRTGPTRVDHRIRPVPGGPSPHRALPFAQRRLDGPPSHSDAPAPPASSASAEPSAAATPVASAPEVAAEATVPAAPSPPSAPASMENVSAPVSSPEPRLSVDELVSMLSARRSPAARAGRRRAGPRDAARRRRVSGPRCLRARPDLPRQTRWPLSAYCSNGSEGSQITLSSAVMRRSISSSVL